MASTVATRLAGVLAVTTAVVIGCGDAPTEQDAKAHVREVVRVFLKGYGVAPS